MAIRIHLRSLLLALAVTTAAGAAFAGPAAARNSNSWNHPIYNDRQAWAYVDQNRDGKVSASEWKWARKHGYDRLNGVPKKHLTREEYQRYLSAYLDTRHQRSWRKADYWERQRDDNRHYQGHRDSNPYAQQQPWYYTPDNRKRTRD